MELTACFPPTCPLLQVVPCPRPYGHDWAQCSFSHPGEIRRRRDVRVYQYNSTQCAHTHKVSHSRCHPPTIHPSHHTELQLQKYDLNLT
jgi:hypothetical protein